MLVTLIAMFRVHVCIQFFKTVIIGMLSRLELINIILTLNEAAEPKIRAILLPSPRGTGETRRKPEFSPSDMT